MTIQLRKTRFVCISDTHNASPAEGAFKLPKGDVLVHAGDLTKQGTFAELRKTLDWIEDSDFEVKLVVAGNHDVTLDTEFYAEHSQHFHNQYPQSSEACIQLLKEYKTITYLNHQSLNVRLTKESGPKTCFKVFGSPYSPSNGLWAFSYSPEKASKTWDGSIPLDTDVVITHTPPKFHCDESRGRGAAGCEVLRQKLWRVRPSLVICGHVHEGRAAERIIWDTETPNVKYKELATGYWTDKGFDNRKQSLINLSASSGAPLDNSGSWVDVDRATVDSGTTAFGAKSDAWAFECRPDLLIETPKPGDSSYQHTDGAHPAVWGQGGVPPSAKCDVEALVGRMGRRETCVVNAAIMASSWPYKSNNKRKYNKAIIVDIDLQVHLDEDEDFAGTKPASADEHSTLDKTTESSQIEHCSMKS